MNTPKSVLDLQGAAGRHDEMIQIVDRNLRTVNDQHEALEEKFAALRLGVAAQLAPPAWGPAAPIASPIAVPSGSSVSFLRRRRAHRRRQGWRRPLAAAPGGQDVQMVEKVEKGGLDDDWSQPKSKKSKRRRLFQKARCRARGRWRAARLRGVLPPRVRWAGWQPEVGRRLGLGGRRTYRLRSRRPRPARMQGAGWVPTRACCWPRGCWASSCGRA